LPTINRVTYRHGLVSDDDLEDLTGLETVLLEGAALTKELAMAITITSFLGLR